MDRKKYVIVMAAGSGTRMGADRPKQFLELGGKAVLQKTIEVFLKACPGISVVTVLPEDFIEGMMCPHCEASVKKALEELDGVLSAEVSHETGTAIVSMNDPVADDVLKSAVEAKDYTVTGIK